MVGPPITQHVPICRTTVAIADIGAAGSRFGLSGVPAPSVELFHLPSAPRPEPDGAQAGVNGTGLPRPFGYSDIRGLELNADAFEACLHTGLRCLAAGGMTAREGTEPAREEGCPPTLLVEPTQASKALRRKLAESVFERTRAPAAFIAKRAALSAFAHGHTTTAVLDLGASHSCAAVVLNGWVVPERVRECMAGGDLVDRILLAKLCEEGTEESTAGTAGSVALCTAAVKRLKESACAGGSPPDSSESRAAGDGGCSTFQLPDGKRVTLGSTAEALREVTEKLFFGTGPTLELGPLRVRRPLCKGEGAKPMAYAGLHSMLLECAALGDDAGGAPVPRHFGRSVVLTGGSAQLPGLAERLQAQLSQARGRLLHAKVSGRSAVARNCSAAEEGSAAEEVQMAGAATIGHSCWTGGSILASLGAFESFWVTRAEYEEGGMGAVEKKCP